MKKLLSFIGVIIYLLLTACQEDSLEKLARLTEEGVSHELALFRKANYERIKYELDFSIPEAKDESVTGKVNISFLLAKKTSVIIDFKAEESMIQGVSLSGKKISYLYAKEHIILDESLLNVGEQNITIEFTVPDQSLNRRDEFLYTLLVPDRARTLFPCFDQPDMKSLYTLTLEIPADWEAVANGALKEMEYLPGMKRKLFYFTQTEPLSTYLFSFVAGKLEYEIFNRNDRDIAIYYRENDPKKVAQCPDIADEVFDALEWLEDYTSIPYPFEKYDVIILPGFQYGGMEHTGATLYTDRRMFLNEQPTLNERLSRSSLIAHETAHMWFGDYVTMQWFDDVWTKEVFANYFASRIVEPLYQTINHRLNFIRDYVPSAYSEDRTAGTNAIKQGLDNLSNAGLVYGQIIYNKSPIVMEMLVEMIGEEAFQKGIREYLRTYAYGNADWKGLIEILNNYTEKDLRSWSQVWVNEKGMPQITATITGNQLTVVQQDPWKRNLVWPQDLNYLWISGTDTIDLSIPLINESFQKQLPFDTSEGFIIPNWNGKGYGTFLMNESDIIHCMDFLHQSNDDVLSGLLLINLYENLLNQNIDPEWYIEEMLKYISNQNNPLLFSMALGYMTNCQRIFGTDRAITEEELWQIVETNKIPQHKLQAFRSYISTADSQQAIQRLYSVWKEQKAPAGCILSESDYINLSYTLAIHMPEQAEQIVTIQQSRLKHPDRQQEYTFISPSVSPDKTVRDSVFASLLIADNRTIEPWASIALSNLNHRISQQEAVKYIRPGLDILQDVQRTGDIFFPTNWLRSLLSSHTSKVAKSEIEEFFIDYPQYPEMLKCKILQQADHLYRIEE